MNDIVTTRSLDHETWELPGPYRPAGFTSAPAAMVPPLAIGGVFMIMLGMFSAWLMAVSVFLAYGLLALAVWACTIERGGDRPAFHTRLRIDHEGVVVAGRRIEWDVLTPRRQDTVLVLEGLEHTERIETGLSSQAMTDLVTTLSELAELATSGDSDVDSHVALEALLGKAQLGNQRTSEATGA